MLEAFSPRHRRLTVALLAVCGLAAIAAAAVGISDNLPGILGAYLAAGAFVLAWAHPWRTERQFARLAWGSLIAFAVFLGLSALLEVAANQWIAAGAARALVQGLVAVSFLLGVILCPAAFLVGAIAGIGLGIRDRRRGRDRGTAAP